MIVLWCGLAFFVGALLGAVALAFCVACEDNAPDEEKPEEGVTEHKVY